MAHGNRYLKHLDRGIVRVGYLLVRGEVLRRFKGR
jgi:hypothetical protein